MTTANNPPLTLVSHLLCPYVQRAAIVLTEKAAPFERRYIDLANKPDWFLKVSPLGKTPVLLVGEQPIFESAVICEYLEDAMQPRLHPADPLLRAQHRAWMEFGSTILHAIAAFYSAADEAAVTRHAQTLASRFMQVEQVVSRQGPYFSGGGFCIVDAVFAPIFRYFDVFDEIADFGILADQPYNGKWRAALAQRASVKHAVRDDYAALLRQFLIDRNSALSRLIAST